MTTSPLVINTRPGMPGELLQEALIRNGHNALHQPAITIDYFHAPVDAELTDLMAVLANPNTRLIFVSRNAVIALAKVLDSLAESELGPFSLFQHHCYAVGSGTAAQLLQSLDIPSRNISVPKATDSEGIIEQFEFSNEESVAIFKGLRGRETLAEHFQRIDVKVSAFSLYNRAPASLASQCAHWPKYTNVVVTSVEIANAILQSATQAKRALNDWVWIVFSDRIKQQLLDEKVEIKQIYVCEQMDNSSIIKTIENNLPVVK